MQLAIVSKHSLNLFKFDTKQGFLNGDEKIYVRPPDLWPEHVLHGYALELMKNMYGTRQAARQWRENLDLD